MRGKYKRRAVHRGKTSTGHVSDGRTNQTHKQKWCRRITQTKVRIASALPLSWQCDKSNGEPTTHLVGRRLELIWHGRQLLGKEQQLLVAELGVRHSLEHRGKLPQFGR